MAQFIMLNGKPIGVSADSLQHPAAAADSLQHTRETEVASEVGMEAPRSSEEVSSRFEQLQQRCCGLQARLAAAMEAEDKARRRAEDDQRKIADLERECDGLRDAARRAEASSSVQMAADAESAGLRDRIAHVSEAEAQALKLAEEHLRLCERLEQKQEHLMAGGAFALEDLQEQLKKVSEESALKSSQLEQQIVSAAEGELQACQRVEEGLEKNRQLVRQNEQLRNRVKAHSEASDEWKLQSETREFQYGALQAQVSTLSSSASVPSCGVDDELFIWEQRQLEDDEQRLRALVSSATDAERQACHVASAELFKLRCECEDLRKRMADTEEREKKALVQQRSSDESERNQQLESSKMNELQFEQLQRESSKMKEEMAALLADQRSAAQLVEPEIEKSPQLDGECRADRNLLSDFGSARDSPSGGSLMASSRLPHTAVLDQQLGIAQWEERIAQEVAARKAVESRLQTAVRGLEQLRPEYERFREHATKAVDAEKESQKHAEQLTHRIQDLQKECEDLRAEGRRSEDVLRERDELRKKLATTENRHLQRECKELRKRLDSPTREIEVDELAKIKLLKYECEDLRQQVATAIEVEMDVSKLVAQLRDQLDTSLKREKIAQGLSEERMRHSDRLELECKELRCRASKTAKVQHLVQDAAAADAWHQCSQLEKHCQQLRDELAKKAKATAVIAPLLEDAAAAEAFYRCEGLEKECEQLQEKIRASASASTSAQTLLGYAASMQEEDLEIPLYSCIEDGLRHNQAERHLDRDCGRLHRELEVATYAEIDALKCAESRLVQNEQLQCELQEQRLQIRLQEQAENALKDVEVRRCADSRLEVNERVRCEVNEYRLQIKRYEQAEKDDRGTCEALQRTCEALQKQAFLSSEEARTLSQELHTARAKAESSAAKAVAQELDEMRMQTTRAAEAERTARRSAEAATELLRRKEELRRVRQVKDQVVRSVEAEKEARRSAGVAVGLKRLIHDLGQDHADASGATRPSGVLSMVPPGAASEAMPSLGLATTKALQLPTFGI